MADMNEIAVRVENLSKRYLIGGPQEKYQTLRDVIAKSATAPLRNAYRLIRGQGGSLYSKREMWALDDVSFEIRYGEAVGIIGRNGAGKSTLLKILSRITEPSKGYADIYGRVGALLEVGTGFHAELTGRENIYLNGAILGMSRHEINRKLDEIIDFSGVEKFIDTPVKHYSSGMGLRLGFAVAAHLEPEILVVDEVLAVGDAQFQKKCLGKMSDVVTNGRTVLFVSHNMQAIQNLCNRAIWLESGKVVETGEPDVVIANYLNNAVQTTTQQIFEDMNTAPGNEQIRVKSVRVAPTEDTALITMITSIQLEFEYWNLKPDTFLNLSLHIYTVEGVLVFNTAPVHDVEWLNNPYPQGMFKSVCYIPGYLLNSGTYRVTVLFVEDQARIVYKMEDALVFDVAEAPETRGETSWFGKWPGVVHPRCEWKTQALSVNLSVENN